MVSTTQKLEEREVEMSIMKTDVVIVPAKDEERGIGEMLSYLLGCGFETSQIVVVDSNSTDKTADVARAALGGGNEARVISQAEVLGGIPELRARFGFDPSPISGKGAAMYAALHRLQLAGHPRDARVMFFDADISNPGEIDLVGSLLRAWESNPNARLAKLASRGRDNEGVIAYINMLPEPYRHIAWLMWPLCGQQMLRLSDLLEMPLPIGYDVEMAINVRIVEKYGWTGFAQGPMRAALADQAYEEPKYTLMYIGILRFIDWVLKAGGLSKIADSEQLLREWNQKDRTRPALCGGETLPLTVQALLPPLQWLD